jgi:lipoprotein-anchoring transpeptidase ErfK/SrfK
MQKLTGPSSHLRADRPRILTLLTMLGLLVLALSPLFAAPTAAQGADGGAITERGSSSANAPDDWSPPRTVYSPQTGQSIDGVFLDYWRNGGGADAFGYPITPELKEDGHTVQYYGYARFEYWPNDPDGNVVHLAKIGEELRPHVVLRSHPVIGGSNVKDDAAAQAASIAKAWLPLDAETAKRANTDTWRYVPETRHSVQLGFKNFWESTGGADYLGYPLTQEYTLNGITYQVFERGQLAWSQGKDPWMVPVGELLTKRYKLSTKATNQGDIPAYSEDLFVPPAPPEPEVDPNGEKWIEVNLSEQYMIAWQGDTSVIESYVSTGRPGFDTPTGTFYINTKLESQTMEGVLGGEYYNVPDVPWVMYFTDEGHALHGTYWHNNFGATMSHGCVNLPMDVAAFMYDWAPVGTRVEIHY